jgi:acyl-lipid omega-6 desaturase (Delta-12 desaturase)
MARASRAVEKTKIGDTGVAANANLPTTRIKPARDAADGQEPMEDQTQAERAIDRAAWREIVARYQKSSARRALWQLVNTLVPYAALWVFIYWSLQVSVWLVVPLGILMSAFQVRIFIIFHDCGHGSFFKSRLMNDGCGMFCGLLTFMPYYHWRWEHSLHHATAGNLDRRGVGDVWTMTVQEYLDSSRWQRFAYRLVRNPFVLFVLAPIYLFIIRSRFSSSQASQRERFSVYGSNLAILGAALGMGAIFGLKTYLVIQFSVLMLSGAAGVWLFYVQHQFEGVYWERRTTWDYATAALKGSSFYQLPRILQWFSGNIGFHHIHHLSPRIPNYYLEQCHKANPLFQSVKPITLLASVRSFTFRLWDEQRRKLVSFRHLRAIRRQQGQVAQS